MLVNQMRYINTDRTQSTHVDYVISQPHHLQCGVPQGSILGPRLYSLYTAPVSDIIALYAIDHQIYADDTTLYMSFQVKDTRRLCSVTEVRVKAMQNEA